MDVSQVQLSFVSGTLLLRGVLHERLRGWFSDVVWVFDARVGASRCDGMRYGRVCEELRRRDVAFEDLVGVPRPVYWAADSLPELRPEQAAAVEAWQQAGGRGCVVMPTGTGKTEVALRIMQLTRTATLVVAPIRDLMYQWHRRILRGLHYDAGIIGDNTYRVQPVSVTTYDSACIHMAELGDRFGLIVFDECHHLPGRIRQDAARMSTAQKRLGLTATPERSDGRHSDLLELVGPTAYELSINAVRGKSLAEYEVVRIPVHLSESEQRRYDLLSEEVQSYVYAQRQENAGFTWEDLCSSSAASLEARQALKAFHAKKSIEDRAEEKLKTLEDLFRLHAGERCIVFAGSNAMARDVSVRFLIPCLLSHCGRRERLEILEGFAAGDYPAIVANQVLDEGIDVPAAKVAIVIGGLGSSRQARQRLGRVLRRSGNETAVLYEVVCAGTKDEERSRQRRRHESFQGVRRKPGRS
ncbi:MAG: DEAD/DEAH box helicase family protein [Planctomyces sp.]